MNRFVLALLLTLSVIGGGCTTSKPDCLGTATVCAGTCTNLESDNGNCGACGAACGAGLVCSNGDCRLTCAPGLLDCGGSCIDPRTDRTFCGASGACVNPTAGQVCRDGEVCSEGQCQLTCQSGLVDCNGQCTDPLTSRLHCGASGDCTGTNAGEACAAGQVCAGGACAASCLGGQVLCGGKCVDPMTDRSFCGASGACTGPDEGTACAAGEICSAGACVPNCPAGQVSCDGACVDPMSDRAHCGAFADCAGPTAGTACAPGLVCSAGTCALSCQAGLTECSETCVDPAADGRHCGACGNACAPGQVCSGGACRLSCQAGLVDCGGRCVDPMTDRAFCGAAGGCDGPVAGTVCAPGQICSAGTCALTCQIGLTTCGGTCVDLSDDREHCGACGTACAAGQVCSGGACALSCQPGLVDCGGRCVDPLSDRSFCGAFAACAGASAGAVCAAGELCSGGACVPSCLAGQVLCGGKCVDPMTDRAFCGASGACAGGEGGTACASGQVCSGGTCVVSCQAGLADCAGQCVNTASDRDHCGACGNACGAGEVCSGGRCLLSCQAGLVNCGGRCVDPATDRAFCGASGTCSGTSGGAVCGAGQVCSNGACALSCQPGLVDCGGTCVDPLRDPRHCGADLGCGLGQTCGDGFACDTGRCVLDCQAGLVDCNGRCVDPATDRAFCGASAGCAGPTGGTVCASGEVCSLGACTPNCPGGQVACGGRCVDPQYDPDYCGAGPACAGGNGCQAGEACYQGVCHGLCAPGLVMCDGACVDPLVDAGHCGASGYCTGASAGTACAPDHQCSGGTCVCPAGLLECAGRCIDPLTDAAYCGASGACTGAQAGTVCAGPHLCAAGACLPMCAGMTFAPMTTYATGGITTGVEVGDVNGDGLLDLVSATRFTGQVEVFLGNGNGTFAAGVARAAPPAPNLVLRSLTDLDLDGDADLVVCGGSLSVMWNDGGGGFTTSTTLVGGTETRDAVGDLNGDGATDLLVLTYSPSMAMTAYLNDGRGGFSAAWSAPLPFSVEAPALADLDGDGTLDAAVAELSPEGVAPSAGLVLVFPGNGDGTFAAPVQLTSVKAPFGSGLAAGDVDGNGAPDLISANGDAGTISVFLNLGGGVFGPRVDYPAGARVNMGQIADLDRDGIDDVFIGNAHSSTVGYILGTASGALGPMVSWACSGFNCGNGRVADLDRDGKPDLVEQSYSAGLLGVHLNRCPVAGPGCTWEAVEGHALDALPPGSDLRQGAAGAAGIAAVAGRTAFLVTSDWGLLRIPTALAGEAAFATEVDVYVPPAAGAVRIGGISAFSDWAATSFQRAHGSIHYLRTNPPSTSLYERALYAAGAPCEGWGVVGQSCTASLTVSRPVSAFEGAWHRLRVEGVRASCLLRTYVDGFLVDTSTGTCDLTGSNFILEGHSGAAFSNLVTYRGSEVACVQ